MPVTHCPSCRGQTFELVPIEPRSKYSAYCFFQCSQCGAPMGVTEAFNVVRKIANLEEKLDKCISEMQAKLVSIDGRLSQIIP